MSHSQKTFIIILVLVTVLLVFFVQRNDENSTEVPIVPVVPVVQNAETMQLTVFVQNKEIARVSDCGVTQKMIIEVPKTTAVADASLKFLFQEELAQYGSYKSVSIENGVAKVVLENHIQSLASCELAHLTSVVRDTLTQYPTITSVELYGPRGKLEF